jgi:hypothetical protein
MLTATVLAIFVTPLFYVLIRSNGRRRGTKVQETSLIQTETAHLK